MLRSSEHIREAKRIRESGASDKAGRVRYNGQDKYFKCFDTYIAYIMIINIIGRQIEIPFIREETV